MMFEEVQNVQPGTPYLENVSLQEEQPSGGSPCSNRYQAKLGGRSVVVKQPREFNEDKRKRIHQVIQNAALRWQQLPHHDNVHRFLGIVQLPSPMSLGLVTEWIELGTVILHLKEGNKNKLIVLEIAKGVACGLAHLHSKDIIHGNLSANNVLLNALGIPVITDFGHYLFTGGVADPTHSLARYVAPELYQLSSVFMSVGSLVPSLQSDTYTFAMFLLELYTLKMPFAEIVSHLAVVQKVMDGHRPCRPSALECIHGELSDVIWRIMESCWQTDPSARPSMMTVVNEMWV